MSQKNRSELRKKDFLVIRQTKNQNIVKVITPHTFQVGLDADEFKSALVVKGNVQVGARLLDATGSAFIKGSGSVTVTEDASGGVTISATLGTGATLTGAEADGIEDFTYDGSSTATVKVDLFSNAGIVKTSNGLALNISTISDSISTTPAADDLLFIYDTSLPSTRFTKKITVGNLMAAASSLSTLGNPLVLRDGLGNTSYNNSAGITVDIDTAANGGLNIIGGAGSGGAVYVDPNTATATTTLNAANDYVLIYDQTANATRKIVPQKFANLPSDYSLSAGLGLTYSAGSAFNVGSNSTLAIDTAAVPLLSSNNLFSGKTRFGISTTAGLTGSLQEASPGVPYLVGGSNVSITTSSNGQVMIAASMGAGGDLTAGTGISSFTYNGSSPATVAVNATNLSPVAANRNNYVITAEGSNLSNITRTSIASVADAVDRTAIINEGSGIAITFAGNSNPASIAAKVDGTTIKFNGSNQLTATTPSGGTAGGGDSDKAATYLVLSATGSLSAERVLTPGTGISTTDAGAGGAFTVAIDNSIVATLTGSQFSGNIGITGSLGVESNAIFRSGLSGSLTKLPDGTSYLREGSNIRIVSGSDGSVIISALATGGDGDAAAQYLVLSATGSLSAERVLTAGTGISTTDAGAGGAFTIAIDNSIVATLTGSQFSGNVGITGSLSVESDATFNTGLTGSLQMLSDGTTPYIIGTGSVSITTSSSGQLVVSSSAAGDTGLSSIEQSGGSTFNNISTLIFTGSTLSGGSGTVTVTPVIGAAEDSSYTDGLFTDFSYTTPIGTAVDRFNEVLKGLAPSAAPSLDDIDCSDSGTTAKLSFGSSQSVSGYTNVQPSVLTPTDSLSDVNINGTYNATIVSNDVRVACFTGATIINGTLNADISADGSNYAADSFGNADQGTLELFVNDNSTPVHTVDLNTFGSGNSLTNGSGFNLTAKTAGHFADGSNFETFQHRQGTYTIAAGVLVADVQRSGWNYARIVHTIGGSSTTTNYVEWVNDPNASALSADTSVMDSLSMSGTRQLSGVTYNTAGTAEYRVRVLNAYKNVYSSNSITFNGTNCVISSQAFPSIDYASGEDETKLLHLTGSVTINSDPLLNGSITASANVPAPLKSDLTSAGSQSVSGILLYNLSDSATTTSEPFRGESYRRVSGSYNNQAAVTDSGAVWNSSTSLMTVDGLLFYNSALRSPRQGTVSGDFRNTADGGSITNGPASNVNYSSITSGMRTFYRYFKNTSGGSKTNFALTLNGSGTIVNQASSLSSSSIHVLAKLPTTSASFTTGWMDTAVAFATGQTGDGAGCLNGSLDSSLNATNNITFGTQSAGANEYIVIKIEADATWTGNISQISISWS